MARYQPVDTQSNYYPIDIAAQLRSGTFEHVLHHLLDEARRSDAVRRAVSER
ncbi:hypothetical protein [Gemmatimonas sp.]|uniref:hypothetical protein n=1 Tax=Gemmatimonas sp. TaxID=1962908 RepID=UPI00286E795E|nr:hypothetical protein [Gemmatimonas sp.]